MKHLRDLPSKSPFTETHIKATDVKGDSDIAALLIHWLSSSCANPDFNLPLSSERHPGSARDDVVLGASETPTPPPTRSEPPPVTPECQAEGIRRPAVLWAGRQNDSRHETERSADAPLAAEKERDVCGRTPRLHQPSLRTGAGRRSRAAEAVPLSSTGMKI
ncbi:hypothetical protein EYF80_041756 [Liparis tanakae]|uniref:Uncharacterized protein n=1 Tax=Liparis tanakae TaxID=230148 RepID=A0A4Z2G418_9TELE|nr:hypothetical protein EYF80_041756 [Liparis tanakae]